MMRAPTNWRSRQVAVWGIVLVACSASTEPVHAPEVVERPLKEPPRESSSVVGVALTARPRKLSLDGSFEDWGPPPPLTPSLPAPTARTNIDPPIVPVRHNPPAARSRVTFAVDHDGAALAVELDGAEEVWIGIGSTPAELPVLGEYFGRMGFVPTNCLTSPRVSQEEGSDSQGYWMEDNPPEVVAACEVMLARVAEQGVAHDQRFERWFRIDAHGVEALRADGFSAPLAGAKVVAGPPGATRKLEVELPLQALPRIAEAPVTLLRLAASTKAPTSLRPDPSAWVWLEPPRPIDFAPYGALLTHAFKRANDVGDMPMFISFRQPRALSYQPADTNRLEFFDSGLCADRTPREIPLYTALTTASSLEVGLVAAPRGTHCDVELEPWLVIQHKGSVKAIVKLNGPVRETVERADEVHVISWSNSGWEATAASFSAIAIAEDGSHREAVLPLEGLTTSDPIEYWSAPEVFSSNAHETFGWRATRGTQDVTATFRWEAAKKQYVGSWKAKPTMKQTKAR